ncbi:MAG: type II toxin-antitoxin system VapC family toxin [Elusimicrobia bacterium]|nr:type II toxin-antitoxin system VapC family toxin [Elusimicrobiota bacterium]
MRLFLDSSALAKRYIQEPGTETVLSRCREAQDVFLSVLCVPVLISGFNRLKRERKISRSQYRLLKRRLAADMEQASVVGLTPSVLGRTISCLERTPLKTLDALHIAAALESPCDLFLTADRRQHGAAVRLRLKAEVVGEPIH